MKSGAGLGLRVDSFVIRAIRSEVWIDQKEALMHLFSTDSQSKFLARRNPLTIAEGPSIARLLGLVKTAVMVVIRTVGRRRLQRKVICLAVAVNLLLWPGPGILARDLLTQASQVFTIHIDFSSYAAVFLKRLFSTAPARPSHETMTERTSAVAMIKLNPIKYVGYVDETITLAALPADYLSRTVQGVTSVGSPLVPTRFR